MVPGRRMVARMMVVVTVGVRLVVLRCSAVVVTPGGGRDVDRHLLVRPWFPFGLPDAGPPGPRYLDWPMCWSWK